MIKLRLAATVAAIALALPLTPALAKKADAAPAQSGPATADAKNISPKVRPFLIQAQKLEGTGDNAGALAQLRSAEATGNLNATDQFYIAQLKLGLAGKLNDEGLMEEALKASATNEFLPATEKPKYLRNLASMAIKKNDYNTATTQFEQIAQMTNAASDYETLGDLYAKQKQIQPAIGAYEKAIAAGNAAGKPADEATYQKRLQLAYDNKIAAAIPAASADLVKAYPTTTNWRNVLYIYRETAKVDDQGNLDTLRLMQAVGALNGERDYAEFIELLIGKGLPGEAKSVADDGVAKGALAPGKGHMAEYSREIAAKVGPDRAGLPGIDKEARAASTGKVALGQADAYAGYGDYAKAIEFYRLALAKGSVDSNVANLHLGAALARSGDKAGAATAFQAVQGSRAPLAQYWLIWLAQKA